MDATCTAQTSLPPSGNPMDMQFLYDAVHNFPLLNASDLLHLQPTEFQQLSWDLIEPYDLFSTGEYESSTPTSSPLSLQLGDLSPEIIALDPASAFFYSSDETSPIDWSNMPAISPAHFATHNQYTTTDSSATISTTSRSCSPEESCVTTAIRSTTTTGNKTKKMRFRATKQELEYLLHVFESNPFPSASQRKIISEKLKLEPKQVLFWFQNRRATLKSNGIVAVKPKKTSSGGVSSPRKDLMLEQLSPENPYFYVADKSALL
ncbi:hypothetical protein BDR26DRAFT_864770 [Obelidium mucronatum]|nr:hypothetical protein BDR26DRAFT_864770 [Obelidium mucronatum]